MILRDFLDGSGVSGSEEDYIRIFNNKGNKSNSGNPFSVFESDSSGGGGNNGGGNDFKTLELDSNATPQMVQRAYFQLARKYHPDSGDTPDNSKFIEVKQAYERLRKGNPDQQQQQQGSVRRPNATSSSSPFGNFDDSTTSLHFPQPRGKGFPTPFYSTPTTSVSTFTGHISTQVKPKVVVPLPHSARAPPPTVAAGVPPENKGKQYQEIRGSATIPLETFVVGGTVVFEYTQILRCPTCEQQQQDEDDVKLVSSVQECFECSGTGTISNHMQPKMVIRQGGFLNQCYYCGGKGRIEHKRKVDVVKMCGQCRGAKTVTEKARLDFSVPSGTLPGNVLTFENKGHYNSFPLHVTLQPERDKMFEVSGRNLYMIRKLSMRDAFQGYSSNTILPGGEKVFFRCTRPVQTGSVMKIAGKGLLDGKVRGDLYIMFNLESDGNQTFRPEQGQFAAVPVSEAEQKTTKDILEKRGKMSIGSEVSFRDETMFVDVDTSGCIRFVSEDFRFRFCPSKSVVGKPISVLIPRSIREQHDKFFQRSVMCGGEGRLLRRWHSIVILNENEEKLDVQMRMEFALGHYRCWVRHKDSKTPVTQSWVSRSFPWHVAHQIVFGDKRIIDNKMLRHNGVVVIMADISNYTRYCSVFHDHPEEAAKLIQALYLPFDKLLSAFPTAFKLETVGDNYVVVVGLGNDIHDISEEVETRVLNETLDSETRLIAAEIAVSFLTIAKSVLEKFSNMYATLGIRIAVHAGDIVESNFERLTPRFHTHGHVMNVCARMQHECPIDSVIISDSCLEGLEDLFRLKFEEKMNVQGKNMICWNGTEFVPDSVNCFVLQDFGEKWYLRKPIAVRNYLHDLK